ncbi:hypothetical protein EYF80_065883 [Liparis tanakae]|uniref:Uncharacterized protein n=1 Tax=Liparis tanakae TaxID=230148 RepID=A0A4Z2E6M6_9TELE|nr:hypothetical protein EYF80_065883 [Liparis tanakae]
MMKKTNNFFPGRKAVSFRKAIGSSAAGSF